MWYACYIIVSGMYIRRTRIFAARASLALQEFQDQEPTGKSHRVIPDPHWIAPDFMEIENG